MSSRYLLLCCYAYVCLCVCLCEAVVDRCCFVSVGAVSTPLAALCPLRVTRQTCESQRGVESGEVCHKFTHIHTYIHTYG